MAVIRQTVELANFGARPTLISELLGKRVSQAEIKRIFKLASPRESNHGRLPDARKIARLHHDERTVLARLLQSYMQVTSKNFEHIDAVLATWRVHAQALAVNGMDVPSAQPDFELFLVGARFLKAGRIDLRYCQVDGCRAPNIFCTMATGRCSSCNRRIDPHEAETVRGSEKHLVNPAYVRPRSRLKVA